MSEDAPPTPSERKKPTTAARVVKYVVITTYVVGFLSSPQWLPLMFPETPVVTEQAALDGVEAQDFETISWNRLGGFPYEFEMAGFLDDASPEVLAERNERLIPTEVRALDGQPVAVRGYAIPVSISQGRVTDFILAAKNEIGCCFGAGLAMNQWIHVAVPEGQVFDIEPYEIATILGRLEVGEEVKQGTVLSLYRLRDATARRG